VGSNACGYPRRSNQHHWEEQEPEAAEQHGTDHAQDRERHDAQNQIPHRWPAFGMRSVDGALTRTHY
jgi:hypothetical protein